MLKSYHLASICKCKHCANNSYHFLIQFCGFWLREHPPFMLLLPFAVCLHFWSQHTQAAVMAGTAALPLQQLIASLDNTCMPKILQVCSGVYFQGKPFIILLFIVKLKCESFSLSFFTLVITFSSRVYIWNCWKWSVLFYWGSNKGHWHWAPISLLWGRQQQWEVWAAYQPYRFSLSYRQDSNENSQFDFVADHWHLLFLRLVQGCSGEDAIQYSWGDGESEACGTGIKPSLHFHHPLQDDIWQFHTGGRENFDSALHWAAWGWGG